VTMPMIAVRIFCSAAISGLSEARALA
jgi:hypothetical protein